MVQDRHNLVPVTLAVLMHVILFGSLFVVIDMGRRDHPAVPLAIKGTLVTDNAVVIPPKVEEPPPRPDTSEQERLAAEEQKRIDDARIEQERMAAEEQKRLDDARIEKERIERIRQQEAEQKRLAEEAERKRQADEQRRRQEAEAEQERKRVEAERRRQEEIERQRQENERLRREAESTARQAEIDAESERLAAVDAGELAAYRFALQQKVERNWVKPASSPPDLECEVRVQQLAGGEVVNVSILTCNGDAAVRRSIEAAINKASPLPTPRNPNLFDRNLRFTFRPEQ
ncbi:hypothetical protein GWP57_09785 [Gammaproteobacteria bacterium]|jgi:colicin import membrane protein|nr:hypothetical protein [Gammaproteobacteria bacterium]